MLARKISRAYGYLMIFGALALAASGWMVIQSLGGSESAGFIPALVIFGWCLLLLCFINLFRHVPSAPATGERWLKRVLIRSHRFGLWVIAAGFLSLTLGVLSVSLKLLFVWLSDYPV